MKDDFELSVPCVSPEIVISLGEATTPSEWSLLGGVIRRPLLWVKA